MFVTVAIVIPFYQRERGFLRRALDSVASQKLPGDVRMKIVIVDDKSPLPLAEALEDFSIAAPHELVLLEQRNGGPGAARNAALNALDPNDVDLVAFLDSDDIWFDGHLEHALSVLKNGASFYFSNSEHDDNHSFFYSVYLRKHHDFTGEMQECVRSICGAEAFDAFVDECIPHTSQVVYSFRLHSKVRFDEYQRRAGEDQMFWIALASQSETVSYSTAVMGSRGRGVSVYRETLSWDSPAASDRLIDEIVFRYKLLRSYEFNNRKRREIKRATQKKRDHLLFLSIRNLRSQPRVTLATVRKISVQIPDFWIRLPITVLRLPGHIKELRREKAT